MNQKNKDHIIQRSIEVLNDGGVILYPTDTVWGIGCDATNPKAIEKIYSIKKRSKKKPFILLMDNTELLLNYIYSLPEISHKIINNSTQPTTIIYPGPINLPNILIYQNTIAVRMIKTTYLKELLSIFKKPITSTSANISGNTTPQKLINIDDGIKKEVDYIIPQNFMNHKNNKKSSRIIKIHKNSKIEIIRE